MACKYCKRRIREVTLKEFIENEFVPDKDTWCGNDWKGCSWHGCAVCFDKHWYVCNLKFSLEKLLAGIV